MLCVLPYIKQVEQIFGPQPLSSRAEKENDVGEKTPVQMCICTKCGRARNRKLRKKNSVNNETKNNGQLQRNVKQKIADVGKARKKKEMGEPGEMTTRANFQRL